MPGSKENAYIRPSDARSWNHCKRRVWYDNFPPSNMEAGEPNEFDQLIMDMGIRHEWGIKRDLEQKYQLIEAVSAEHTQALMEANVDIIYQAKIIDKENGIIGEPDFLIRHESGEYQAADAKLARSSDKKEIQIQLGIYRKLLHSTLPALVFLGDKSTEKIDDAVNADVEEFLKDMAVILRSKEPPTVRYSESKCKVCPYVGICKPEFEAKGELTLLYGIDSRSAPHLEGQGIATITKLANIAPEDIGDVPYLKGFEKRQRAVLQAKAYFSNESHQLCPVSLPQGTWIHFDIEVNPLTGNGEEHVYLWGFLKPPYTPAGFDYVWTDHEQDDKKGWLQFLELMEQYRQAYPDLVLAHFSNYEVGKIKSYAKRYNMAEHPIVAWLLGENSPLFDIQKPVKDSFVLPVASYGLKQVCKHEGLVNFQWQDDDSGSQWSVVQFVKYLSDPIKERREQMKKDILTYNFDDVMGTRKLEEWLRQHIRTNFNKT